MIQDFINYCLADGYSRSTIHRTLIYIKSVLKYATDMGIKTNASKIEFYFGQERCSTIVTLSEQELSLINETEVPDRLRDSKHWLLISCYTGQRYSDFIRFTDKQIKTVNNVPCIHFVQQKTKKEILLPLHPIVQKIIENRQGFPPTVYLQKYNSQIKEIAKFVGINEEITTNLRLGHRKKFIRTEKWRCLSSHIGRRSFATNFHGQIPTSLLITATGHSSEKMFLNYIKPLNTEHAVLLNNYFEETYKRRILKQN